VRVTEVAELTIPAMNMNVAEVAPCGTVTLAGTLATELELKCGTCAPTEGAAAPAFELESDTTAPPEGAAAVSLTMPVPDCPLIMALGLTVTLLSATGGGLMVTPNVSFIPERDAVKVTAVGLVTVAAPTVNVVEVAPCATVTLHGKAPEGDELRVTVVPPLGAAEVNATLHVAVDGGVSDTELHENPFKLKGKIVTVPFVVDIATKEPVASNAGCG
jgi:hypothetical protein